MKYLDFLDQYKDKLGITKGITMQEIQDIEVSFSVKLPKAYIEYLSYFGENSGNILKSYLMEFSKLYNNRKSAIYASIDELGGNIVEIKHSYFFFAQWQGYVFYFF